MKRQTMANFSHPVVAAANIRKNYIMSTKPAIQATKPLSSAASKDLVRNLAGVRLTSDRRDALRKYAAAATRAFEAPLPRGVVKQRVR